MKNLRLSDFSGLSQGGIYVFKNENKKLVQVFGSINMLNSLYNLMSNLKGRQYGDMLKDGDDIEFSVLEYTDNIRENWFKWIEYYRNMGYGFYKDTHLPRFSVRHDVGFIDGKMYSLVYIQNGNKDKKLVGVFDTLKESTDWFNTVYPSGIITKVVYCDNKYSDLLKKKLF